MPVSKEQVLSIAGLCRLDLAASAKNGEDPELRVERIAAEMSTIVGYMDILSQVDTDNIEPLYSPLTTPEAPREDKAQHRRTVDEVLSNAPKRKQNFFVVPPVI